MHLPYNTLICFSKNLKILKKWKHFQTNSKYRPGDVLLGVSEKVKNFIAYSGSESLNSHKKTIKKNFDFFSKKIYLPGDPFWPICPFLGFFFEKMLLPKWSPYIDLTSYQKSEKFLEPFLRKKSKTFLTPFWPLFGPKRGQGDFFSKIAFRHFSTFMIP